MRYIRSALLGAAAVAVPLALAAAANPQATGAHVWLAASGQGHCAETVAFAPQLAQRKTGNVCGKWDQGKTGSMPATTQPRPSAPKPSAADTPA
jgi:hypothetical protein